MKNKINFQSIAKEAHEAGIKAVNDLICNGGVNPMIVQQHEDQLDDSSVVVKQYYVPDGACGFAWVNISPGTQSFARYAKKFLDGYKDYYGGISIWVREFNQSIQKKETYAQAYVDILRKYNIKANAGSRLD